MTDPRRARRARESELALTPPATSLTPAGLVESRLGAALVRNNPIADAAAWGQALRTDGLPDAVRVAHAALADGFADVPRLITLVEAAETAAADEAPTAASRDLAQDIASRGRLALAFMGHYPSACIALHEVDLAAGGAVGDAERKLLLTTRAELSLLGHRILLGTYDRKVDGDRAEARRSVWQDLVAEAEVTTFWHGLDRPRGAVRDDTGHAPRDEDNLAWFEEEFGAAAKAAPAAGIVVFPKALLDAVGKGESKRDIERALGKSLGVPLRRIPVPTDWTAWEAELNAGSPWLAAANCAVRAGQGGRSHWDHDAILLVGPAGAGKSRHGGRIAAVSGLPTGRYNLDTTSDNSLGGTPIRWSSGHLGFGERVLAAAGAATALLQYDEADKCAGTRNSGGHPYDILHGLLERETAAAWRSPYLLGEVDLSHNVHLLTANTTDGIPSSLLDRLTVVRVGEPGPEHLGILAPALARQACRELGLDERWGELDYTEISALADAWRGGSVRRLQRLVRGLLQARDLAPVARH